MKKLNNTTTQKGTFLSATAWLNKLRVILDVKSILSSKARNKRRPILLFKHNIQGKPFII